MSYRTFLGACSMVLLAMLAASAEAQQRTFVASTGSDANPCSRALPCRNFAAAAAATLPGGEVVALDSAGYGPVSITQSVSLIAPTGVYAGITAFSGDAVTINAPSATVVLRGLSLNGVGGADGVNAQAVGTLHIENCVISQFSSNGISMTASGDLFVNDTIARQDGYGLLVQPAAGAVTGVVDRCRFEKNATRGVVVGGVSSATKVTLRDSVSATNGTDGVFVIVAEVNVKDCVIANNTTGINGSTNSTVSVAGTMVSDSSISGLTNNGATSFVSFGNNQLIGNTAAETGAITPLAQQ